MAVNTIDKLQFLSFIFAVLLSITIITARRYAKRGICRRRVSVCCLSVCLSVCVCLSHSGIVSKWLNVGSRK